MSAAGPSQEDAVSTQQGGPGPFATRLGLLRWRAGLSRDQLAKLSGVSEHLVQSLEQGRTANPSLRTLRGLAQGLGVTVGELVGDPLRPGDGPG
jgi:transcriptional regulator with XRE-family HTH domain